eukprot:34027-Chlamydomonas_euryale.AAC.1
MHGSREGRAMQGSSSKGQLQQCMAAAERGQFLTVERGSLAKVWSAPVTGVQHASTCSSCVGRWVRCCHGWQHQ